MIEQTLHTGWTMRRAGEQEWLPASVPGSVYGDLLSNGRMEDPFWKDNEDKALSLMEYDYEYVTQFDCPEEIRESDRVLLHFDGLDTIADVYLNGEHLGNAYSMHRIWEYDVKEKVRPAGNELRVVLHSPTKFIRQPSRNAVPWEMTIRWRLVHIRKAHYMFGWDWGPRLPDAGIWRPVKLLAFDHARLDGVYITQKHEPGRVALQLRVDVQKAGRKNICRFGRDEEELEGLSWRVR